MNSNLQRSEVKDRLLGLYIQGMTVWDSAPHTPLQCLVESTEYSNSMFFGILLLFLKVKCLHAVDEYAFTLTTHHWNNKNTWKACRILAPLAAPPLTVLAGEAASCCRRCQRSWRDLALERCSERACWMDRMDSLGHSFGLMSGDSRKFVWNVYHFYFFFWGGGVFLMAPICYIKIYCMDCLLFFRVLFLFTVHLANLRMARGWSLAANGSMEWW